MAVTEMEMNFDSLETTMKIIGEMLKEELTANLLQQGHKATNELINSIEMKVNREMNFISLDGMFLFYGRNVDQGRRPGVKRVPLDALIEWVKQKGFATEAKKVKGIAFAIQKTIFEKGISTPQSWRGEETKNWMTDVLERNTDDIADLLSNEIEKQMSVWITNMITSATSIYHTNN